MYRYTQEDFSILCIAMGVCLFVGGYFLLCNSSDFARTMGKRYGVDEWAYAHVAGLTLLLFELYMLPVFLAKVTGLLWLRHFRLVTVFIPIVYRLKKIDQWLKAKEQEAEHHD